MSRYKCTGSFLLAVPYFNSVFRLHLSFRRQPQFGFIIQNFYAEAGEIYAVQRETNRKGNMRKVKCSGCMPRKLRPA